MSGQISILIISTAYIYTTHNHVQARDYPGLGGSLFSVEFASSSDRKFM